MGTVLIAVFSIWFGSANGSSSFTECCPTPEERLPLQLFFNATHDGLSGNEVSRIQLTLYDNRTNEKVLNVTYFLTIKAAGDDDPFLTDTFYAQNGTATIILAHNDENTIVENGVQEQFLNAWVVDASEKPHITTISSPKIQENGTFQLTLELLTIDYIRNFFREDNFPRVDYVLDTSTDVSTQFTLVPEFPLALPILVVAIFISIVYANLKMRCKYRANA